MTMVAGDFFDAEGMGSFSGIILINVSKVLFSPFSSGTPRRTKFIFRSY